MEPIHPTTQAEAARFLAENAAGKRQVICPVGGRTSLHWGWPGTAAEIALDTTSLEKVVDYPARDMTVTVEAGIRIDALQALLAQERQRLAVDIAQSSRATLGGVVASNTSGPRRYGWGTMRDYVIGITAIDGTGRLFHGGGRVVKNVAGYDLCKLLVGSRGTLAVITQLTLKLRPIPEATELLWLSFDTLGEIENALERLLVSDARPIALDVLNARAAQVIAADTRHSLPTTSPVLCLGVEGTRGEVDWQIDKLRRELVGYGVQAFEAVPNDDANRLWQVLTEFPTLADDPLTFQATLRPSSTMAFAEQATKLGIAVQAHAGTGVVIGQFPDEAATLEQVQSMLQTLQPVVTNAGGELSVLHCDAEWRRLLPMCGKSNGSWGWMRKVKQALDPHNVLNPGQFIDGQPPVT